MTTTKKKEIEINLIATAQKKPVQQQKKDHFLYVYIQV